ncbi:hydrogenase formation protein HypD [bacterium]|nr:hydrogenase formation protein HypD [bacterium]
MDKPNFFNDFKNASYAQNILSKIRKFQNEITIMEFCGGHTHTIFKYGIREILLQNVKMRSGPGCPVCVTSNEDLAKAFVLAKTPNVILTTYGDMLSVPNEFGTLEKLKAEGFDIRTVYSTLDALKIAENNPNKKIVFFAVGFETTAPATAASILKAKEKNLKNYFVSSVLKFTIPVTIALLKSGEVKIDAVLGPGHVSTVIGSEIWNFFPQNYKIPCVISGFEPLDILQSVFLILKQIAENRCEVENEYKRAVLPQGNKIALKILNDVFEPASAFWRGFGEIPESGMKIKKEFSEFDADLVFNTKIKINEKNTACRCGEVLRGLIEPHECKIFGNPCTPENPFGPCMVSSEGSCSAFYKFNKNTILT